MRHPNARRFLVTLLAAVCLLQCGGSHYGGAMQGDPPPCAPDPAPVERAPDKDSPVNQVN